MADTRLVVGIVGAPERAELAEEIGAFVGEFRGAEPIHGIRPRLLANGYELVADLVDRRITQDARAWSVDELHGVARAPVAMPQRAPRGALGAGRAAIYGAVPARLLAE